MMDKPLVWSRGAIGDLLIHLPIAHAKYGDEPFNLVISGPINNEVLQFLIDSCSLEIDHVYHVDTIPRSSVLVTDRMKELAFREFGKSPDLILNHVRSVRGKNSFDICKADEIVDFLVDFTSVSYHFEESIKLLSELPEKYILVCPYSVSNPTWKSESRYHEYLRCLVSYIAKTHDIFDVVICGRCEDRIFGKPFWNNPSLRIFDLTNMTSICDMLTLINHAQNFVVYDSGMKNYAFLTQTPTCFIWNKKWHAANPVEAWFPKQLQTINNNILFDIWKWDENGNL